MKSLIVSVNPSYFCNLRCPFCYLTKNQLQDKHTLDLNLLEIRLAELTTHFSIAKFDLYGGEFSVLDPSYQKEVINRLKKNTDRPINIITNLVQFSDYFFDRTLDISVSFDFSARAHHEQVLKNISLLNRPISILMLASPKLLEIDVEFMIQTFNIFKNITSVEIKPYSSNQSNSLSIKFSEFEIFVQKWINSKTKKNFSFENENRIRSCLQKTYSAYSDDHIYITPKGKFAVLEFDTLDREFFKELNSINDYMEWCRQEPLKLTDICNQCDYLGNCLTEHYRQVNSLENSCSGFKFLLDWYRNEKMEIKSTYLS